MSVTLEEFKAYVGTKDDSAFPEDCLDAGQALVTRLIGSSEDVPAEVEKQAVLVAASEIFHRRSAPMGVSQFADGSGMAVRVGRDPMAAVTPLLLPFIGYGV